MTVYWEYAFAENFLLDGLLLFLALKAARGRVRARNLFVAAAVGGVESILFPLFSVPVWCAYLIKILGGVLIAVLAVHKGTKKTYFFACASFFLMTFALGGLLTAAYSFFDIAYLEGDGYLVESVPVALVFALSGIFAVLVLQGTKAYFKFRHTRANILSCELTTPHRFVKWNALADSGNSLTFHGRPVCVTSAAAIFALFGANPKPIGRMQIFTVNGGKEAPVFECAELTINERKKRASFKNVPVTIGDVPSKEYKIILHTAYMEGSNEDYRTVKNMAVESEK